MDSRYYPGVEVDVNKLLVELRNLFDADYEVQTMQVGATSVLQARKSSTLRDITGLSTALTIKITPEGGLRKKEADEMQMQPNLLTDLSLADPASQTPVSTSANTGADNLTSAHMRNWMECVRSRKTPNANVRAGYNHATAIAMTIAAMQTGQRITFDDATQKVVVS